MIDYQRLSTLPALLPTGQQVTVYYLGVTAITGERLALLVLDGSIAVVLVEEFTNVVRSIDYDQMQSARFQGELAIDILDLISLLAGALIQATSAHEIEGLIRAAQNKFGVNILAVDVASTAHIAYVYDCVTHWKLADTQALLNELRAACTMFQELKWPTLAPLGGALNEFLQAWPHGTSATEQMPTLRDLTVRTVLARAIINAQSRP